MSLLTKVHRGSAYDAEGQGERDAADLAVPSLMPRHLDDEVSHPWTIVWGLLFLGFVTPA